MTRDCKVGVNRSLLLENYQSRTLVMQIDASGAVLFSESRNKGTADRKVEEPFGYAVSSSDVVVVGACQ